MFDMNSQIERSRSEVTVSASPSPVPPEELSADSVADAQRLGRKAATSRSSCNMRTGRWTLDEKLLFLYGLRKYGKGRWKKISVYLPNRSLVQIKSHAQKVIKRYDTGEDVFLRLDENMHRIDALVGQIHDHLKNEGVVIPPAQPGNIRDKKTKMLDAREQIVAASALCQLSQPAAAPLVEECTIRQIVLGTPMVSSSSVVKL